MKVCRGRSSQLHLSRPVQSSLSMQWIIFWILCTELEKTYVLRFQLILFMDPGQLLLPLFYSCGTPVSTRNAALGVKPLQG